MSLNENTRRNPWIIALLATTALLIFIYFSRRVLTPFFIAFALAYLLDPLVDRIESYKLSRTVATTVLMTIFFLLCVGGGLILIPLLRVQAENLIQNLPGYLKIVQGWIEPVLQQVAGMEQDKVQEIINQGFVKFGELPLKILSFASGFLWNSISSLFNIILMIANIIIIPVAMFYLLRDFDRINQKLLALIPPRFRERTLDTLRQIDTVLACFVRGQLMVATLMGALYSAGLFLCGTPMSLFIGMMAGIASLVPYLGVIIGLVPAGLMTYMQTQEWLPVLGVAGVFGIVQALEGMVFTPRVIGDSIGLHPVAIMVAVLIGAEFFGFIGVLLAVPAVAVLNVLLTRGLDRYKDSEFFTSG